MFPPTYDTVSSLTGLHQVVSIHPSIKLVTPCAIYSEDNLTMSEAPNHHTCTGTFLFGELSYEIYGLNLCIFSGKTKTQRLRNLSSHTADGCSSH